jgi:hypothetical protein
MLHSVAPRNRQAKAELSCKSCFESQDFVGIVKFLATNFIPDSFLIFDCTKRRGQGLDYKGRIHWAADLYILSTLTLTLTLFNCHDQAWDYL